MSEFIYTLLIVFVVVIISFLLINVKYFFTGESYKKESCSSSGENCACTSSGVKKRECQNK